MLDLIIISVILPAITIITTPSPQKRLLKPSHLSFEEQWLQVTRNITQLTVVFLFFSVFMGNRIFRQTAASQIFSFFFCGKMRGAGRATNTLKCREGQGRSNAIPSCAMFFVCLLVVLCLFPKRCLRPFHLYQDSHMPCNSQTLLILEDGSCLKTAQCKWYLVFNEKHWNCYTVPQIHCWTCHEATFYRCCKIFLPHTAALPKITQICRASETHSVTVIGFAA